MDMDSSSGEEEYTLAPEVMDVDIAPSPDVTAVLTSGGGNKDGESSVPPTEAGAPMRPRSYQLEMLDEAMKGNIVVAVWPIAFTNARDANKLTR